MLLVIHDIVLVLSLTGSLLLTTPGPAVGVAAAVVYYVTPSEPPNPNCPLGDPCETLDHYASNITGYFDGNDNVTMMFLSGNHTSTSCFTFSCPNPGQPCLNISMVGLRDTINVEIHLECDFTMLRVKRLTMSNLTIHGNENYGVVLEEAPTVGMTLNQVTLLICGCSSSLWWHLVLIHNS